MKRYVFFMLALIHGGWALTCNVPSNISPLVQNGACYEPKVVTGINDEGVAVVLWDVNGKEMRAAFRDRNGWSKPSLLSRTKKKVQSLREPICKVDQEGNIGAYWRFSGIEIDRIEGKVREKEQSTWGNLLVDCDVSAINKDAVSWEGERFLDGEDVSRRTDRLLYCGFKTRATDTEGNTSIAGTVIDQGVWPYQAGLYTQIRFKDGNWSDLTSIGDFVDHSRRCTLSVDGLGNFLLLWRDDRSMALFACFKPVGQPWGEVVQLTSQNEVVAWHRIAADKQGRFVIIWENFQECGYSVHGLTFSANTCRWSDPVQLSPSGKSCTLLSFALSDNGKGIVAWGARETSSQYVLQAVDLFLE